MKTACNGSTTFTRGRQVLTWASRAALAVLLLSGCSSSSSNANTGGSADASTVESGGSGTTVVGAQGGTASSADGMVSLRIPPGALSADVSIAITPATGAPAGAVGSAYSISPEGTTFAVPAELSFAYDPSQLGGAPASALVVATDSNGHWQPQAGSAVDTGSHHVGALTTHLSIWAIVASAQPPCQCDVSAASTCCTTNGGDFTVGTTDFCQCLGVEFNAFVSCYSTQTGGTSVTNFCDTCLGTCCTSSGGVVGDSCSCISDSADTVSAVFACASGCFTDASAPTVCVPSAADAATADAASDGASLEASASVDATLDATLPSDAAEVDVQSPDSAGGDSGEGDDSGQPCDGASCVSTILEAGADAGCTAQTSMTIGAHIKATVSWPASTESNSGSGVADLWLLANLTTTGAGSVTLSGTSQLCGIVLPAVSLSPIGADTVCAGGDAACPSSVEIAFNDTEWDTDITRTFAVSGGQTGWNPGATLTMTPSLSLLGLTDTSYGGASPTAWPSSCATNCAPASVSPICSAGTCAGPDGPFAGSDITDDDGDGFPGITANPLNSSMYTLPPTQVSLSAVPPLADQVYMALRTQMAFSATMTSCTTGSGTATITLFDNHVVGCHSTATTADGGSSYTGPPGPCSSPQVGFLDQNRTIYGPSTSSVASESAPISGTVSVQQLSANATCAEVRAIQ